MSAHPAIASGRTAVITGGASGIGRAAGERFAALGMNVVLADLAGPALDAAAAAVSQAAVGGADVEAVATDVADLAQVEALRDRALARFGDIAVLMNNAGVGGGGSAFENLDGWRRVLGVNLMGVLHGVQAFAPMMIAQGKPAAIVNTGSKQGITTPPGDTAYNVSKAGIKVLTEGLQHSLRNTDGRQVSAHLLVPGFTFTGMTARGGGEKPAAAWTAAQVVEFMLERMAAGDFYILCPDNDVTREMDNARMTWAMQDLTENRPPLSRWHPDYAEAFAAFLAEGRVVADDLAVAVPSAFEVASPVAQSDDDSLRVVTFGCRLNAYESEIIRTRARNDGLTDAVVFNTCSVTSEAVRQARQAIRKARRERPGAKLIVTGCAAQIDPETFAAMGEVDVVLGNAEKAMAGSYRLQPDAPRVRVGDIMSVRETAGHLIDGLRGRARAYVEVQNGCDHRCTFCVIPYGRGNSRSAPAGEVVDQIRRLTADGYNEVVLTGVDLTSWGADMPGQPSLGQLVARILKLVPGLPRLRLSSIDAAEIDDDLLACLAEEPRLMPHLHLSLQAGDDMILKRMKRRHRRADALALIERVRRVRPEIAFGADLIAGFPTETEAMFENTLSLVEEAELSFLHVFPFSPRPGTPAVRMPQLPRAVIKARAERLRAAGAAAFQRHLDAQVGRTVNALVERPGLARAEDFTEVAFNHLDTAGTIVRLRVTGHDGLRAIGERH